MKNLYMTIQYAAQARLDRETVYHYEFEQFVNLADSHDASLGKAFSSALQNRKTTNGWFDHKVLSWEMKDAITQLILRGGYSREDKAEALKSIIETCEILLKSVLEVEK